MAVATMTSKGQLTVPKEIRELLGLKPGDKVDLLPSGEQTVTMRRRRVVELSELFGSLPTNGVSLTLEEIDEAIGDACVERYGRSRR
ncbi:MAG: AbrB/MazE/SpoVT family DNA-binding domain-containing protein [Geminicoccaceae bacterium]